MRCPGIAITAMNAAYYDESEFFKNREFVENNIDIYEESKENAHVVLDRRLHIDKIRTNNNQNRPGRVKSEVKVKVGIRYPHGPKPKISKLRVIDQRVKQAIVVDEDKDNDSEDDEDEMDVEHQSDNNDGNDDNKGEDMIEID